MRKELRFKGLFNSLAENMTPEENFYSMENASSDLGTVGIGKRYINIGTRPNAQAGDVCWGLGYGRFQCNETFKIQVTGSPTGGTFTLRWGAQDAVIPYNATAANYATAFQANRSM